MQAIILAGGKGTRLRPLTLDLPKPVVPFVNRPLLSHQLDILSAVGFTDVTLSLSYQPGKIREIMKDEAERIKIRYVVEEEPLGTGGAIRFACDPRGGSIVVFNGDIINDLPLAAILEYHRSKKAGVTIVLTEVDNPTNYGLVETWPDGRVRQFLEKPGWEEIDGRAINAGTYVIEPEYMELIAEKGHCSIEREFFPILVEKKAPFYAFVHRGYWIDIGTVAKYLRAHSDFFQRQESLPGEYRQVRDQLHAAGGVDIASGIEVHGPVMAGRGTRIEDGAVFSNFCVIGNNCAIGKGAHLDGCVLWDDVTIGAGARLRGCVLGTGSRLGDNTRLSGLFALGSGGYLPDYSHYDRVNEDFGAE